MFLYRCASIATLLVVTAWGCSGGHDYGPTGKIVGTLTMDGKPLSPKTGVQFMEPVKGFLAFGETDASGAFTIASWNEGQMPLGKYKVYITPPPGQAAPAQTLTPEQRFDHPELVEPTARLEFPKKYADMNTSGLEFEVKEGENRFDIKLDPPAKK